MTATFTRESIQSQWHVLFRDTWRVSSLSEQNYFNFYHIDFEYQFPSVVHHFGFIETGEFNIAAHYFDNAVEKHQGTMFVLHGYFDHVGLYGHLIHYFLKQGFSVVAFDLPGHGLSTGEPVSIEHFSDYTNAFHYVIEYFKNCVPMPFSVCGQSTGCAVVMDYLLTQPASDNTFKYITLFAPLVRPAQWRKGQLLYTAARLLFFKRVKRVFWNNSHDKDFLRFLEMDDPLQSKTISVAWVGALKEWIKQMSSRKPSNAQMLIIQGKEDTTVDWKFNIPFIERLFPQATVHYLKEARHHLVNESEELRKTVFDILDDWLNRQ